MKRGDNHGWESQSPRHKFAESGLLAREKDRVASFHPKSETCAALARRRRLGGIQELLHELGDSWYAANSSSG